jgi:hypothetical protein
MKVRRVPWLDEYVEGGESAVLVDDQVFVLSQLGTTILAAVGDSVVEVDEVAAVLGQTYGAPPDGTDLVDATVDALRELAALGLIEMPCAGDGK